MKTSGVARLAASAGGRTAHICFRRLSAVAVGVLYVICTQRTMPASAGEAPAQSGPQGPTNEVQAVVASPTPEQWRRHPSYQVLDHRAALPSMKVAAKGTIEIGGLTKVELEGASQMPADQKKALAAQFELPVAALDRFLQRLAAQQGMGAEQGAKELRTLVIDYRFLRDRWTQYRPPSGQEKTKTEALQCLEAGDLDKVWAMFVALPAPAAPGQLQATKAP